MDGRKISARVQGVDAVQMLREGQRACAQERSCLVKVLEPKRWMVGEDWRWKVSDWDVWVDQRWHHGGAAKFWQ